MKTNSTISAQADDLFAGEAWFDRIEAEIRGASVVSIGPPGS
jgi:hypothetical protein